MAAWQRGDRYQLGRLRDALDLLHAALFAETNPVPLKAALDLLGLMPAEPRLPLVTATQATKDAVARALEAVMPIERELEGLLQGASSVAPPERRPQVVFAAPREGSLLPALIGVRVCSGEKEYRDEAVEHGIRPERRLSRYRWDCCSWGCGSRIRRANRRPARRRDAGGAHPSSLAVAVGAGPAHRHLLVLTAPGACCLQAAPLPHRPVGGRHAGEAPQAMTISDLIRPEYMIGVLNASGKRHALQELSRRASAVTGQSSRAIFTALNKRERLGTTGIGDGIAIPHGKLPGLDDRGDCSPASPVRSTSMLSTISR